MRQSGETMTSVSAGHIILTHTQPVGSGRPQRESNPGPPQQESDALMTELPRPLNKVRKWQNNFFQPCDEEIGNGFYVDNRNDGWETEQMQTEKKDNRGYGTTVS